MTSTTSPHVFKEGNELDIKFIENEMKEKKYQMFIRKVAPEFPDNILENYIYDTEFNNHEFIQARIKSYLNVFVFWGYIIGIFVVVKLLFK
jgi:hypothetical protein